MSGHSKWATTKHRKAAQDAKRSALFSKLSRIITVAAKEGGDPNPENNASLAAAIEKAKGYSLPKDKIKTAIDKAFGSGKDAASYEDGRLRGLWPGRHRRVLRGADRQPQPHRRRRAQRVLACGRFPGHLRLRGVPVRAQGPDHGSQGGRDRRQEEPGEAERRRGRRGRIHARCGRGRRRRLRGRRGRVDRLHRPHRPHGCEEGAGRGRAPRRRAPSSP